MQLFAPGKAAMCIALHQLNCFTIKYRFSVRIMRLTTLILLAGCLQLSAKGLSQNITLSLKDAPLQTVFKEIERQTEFTFFSDVRWLQNAKKVTIVVNNFPLDKVLELCFKEQPFTYSISGKTITIVPRKKEKVDNVERIFSNQEPLIDVKGRVINENGDPVEGVNVTIKGTSLGTITNVNGEFFFKEVDKNAILVFTSVNMETFEIKVKGKSYLDVALQTKITSMQEVVINKGYYTETQRLSTGNVSRVTSRDIERQPINNPLLALQGRVPGVVVTQNSGLPGGGVSVQVQGQISIGSLIGTDPFYVIDGVPYPSRSLYTLSSIQQSSGSSPRQGGLTAGAGSPLSFINPADIESIDILKDADATAIYGSRAANGAILITTKKGKAGKTKVSFNVQTGVGKVAHFVDVLNREQYLAMRHEAFSNDGASPKSTDYDLNGTWDTTRSTNWQEVLIGGTANYTDIQSNVSGGTPNTQFLIGAGYHRETTVFPGDLNDQKASMHFNINNVSSNRKFRLQFSGSYLIDNNKLMTSDLTPIAIGLSPVAPALYNDDGSLNWAPLANGNSTWTNPLTYLYNEYSNKTNNLISNLVINYQLFPGINIKSSLGYNTLHSVQYRGYPLLGVKPERRSTTLRSSDFSNSTISTWIIEPGIDYRHAFGKLEINALLGATFMDNNNNYNGQSGSGYTSDLFMKNISAAPTRTALSSSSQYKYNAVFGRMSGNWEDKYIINLTIRRDGSSRFGAENLFHNFWGIGSAWIFSKESFVSDNIPFISLGKIRASYGSTGNDQIGDYRYLNLYNNVTGVGVAYQSTTGIAPNGLPNAYLQWEETKKLQLGIDLGFLNDKIMLNANYYQNRSSNQLLSYQLPIVTGFTSITRNFPATIQNTGWEIALNTLNVKNKQFTWSSNINLTIPRNKLLKFPGIETSSYSSTYTVGKPVTIVRTFHSLGVDPATGIYIFQAEDGSITSKPTGIDLIKKINTAPKFYGGFQNSFSYKGIQLDVLFQFTKQIGNNSYAFFGNRAGQLLSDGTGNQPVNVLNRWLKPGDIVSVQRFYAVSNSNYSTPAARASASDAVYSDASYVRLKNASLSWEFPKQWKRKISMQDVKIYVQGQNLLTITKYKNVDPETMSAFTLPPLRVITVGIQATF